MEQARPLIVEPYNEEGDHPNLYLTPPIVTVEDGIWVIHRENNDQTNRNSTITDNRNTNYASNDTQTFYNDYTTRDPNDLPNINDFFNDTNDIHNPFDFDKPILFGQLNYTPIFEKISLWNQWDFTKVSMTIDVQASRNNKRHNQPSSVP